MLHPDDFAHRYIQINGIRMHYAQAGTGEQPIIFLHGFPECWWSWRHQLALFRSDLGARFTAIAPDLRGYNETDRPAWGYELDVLVNDVVSLIRELGHTRAIIVGHDWGGIIAWSLAIAYPHRVERLIAMNTPHPARFAEELRHNWRQWLRSWYAAFFQLPFLPEAVLRAHDYALIEWIFRGTAVDKECFTDADIRIFKSAIARPGALTAALNYYRMLVREGDRGMFSGTGMKVHVPTLMIWGEEEAAMGKELTYGTERFVPDLRILYIPRCSHWVQQEFPAEVNSAMLEFLSGLL